MKTTNKLVALLLAMVMVLGMLPAATVHAHEHPHALHTNGVEEYPALELGVEYTANVEGTDHYVTFTPALSTQYRFVGLGDGDTVATLYDDQNNVIANADDCYMHEHANSRQFCLNAVLEAGKTYVLKHSFYNRGTYGTYNVLVTHEHYYEGTVTVPNTCTADGVMTYACACGEGESYTEVIPAAHSFDDEGICTVCGAAYLITGQCGEDLTWELDWDGVLTIKGTGAMYDYTNAYGEENNPAPWYADYASKITKLVVEDGVTALGSYALYNCQSMTEVVLPESVTALGKNTFASCYGLTDIILPPNIPAIPDSCFNSCGALESIGWPAALTSIGSNAFNNCNLGDLSVPEGVTSIGQKAFGGNSNMRMLRLPTTLTEVADYAFANMWDIQNIVFNGNAPAFGGTRVFQYVTANAWYPLGNESWTEEVRQSYSGTITWKGICADGHDYAAPVTVPAACETGSYMTMTCSACGWTEVSPENNDALGHDLVETVIPPNCANWQYGRTEITCTRCDYYDAKDYVPYEHDYVAVVTEATCTADGYTTYTCSVCGEYYTDSYVAAPGHAVAEWSEPTEATCTEDGVKTGFCTNCSQTVSEVVTPALGHAWDMENGTANADGSTTYPCTRCDATYTTEGSALHLGDNQFTIAADTGSATKTYTAAETGKLTIYLNDLYYYNTWVADWTTLAIDYAFSEGAFNVYVNGVNVGYRVEGSEIEARIILDTVTVAAGDVVEVEIYHTSASWLDYTEVRFNVNLALAGSHTHSYEAVVTAPTCTVGGYTTYTCSCGDSYIADETPALGHSYEAVVTAPTCTEGGYTTYTCSVCADSYTADETAALGHDWKGLSCQRCDATRVNPFTDVPDGAFCYDAVLWAVENSVTDGTSETTFSPLEKCKRAHVVTFLWRAAGCPEPKTTVNPFTDVPEDAFYYKAVLWAVEEGITEGTSENTFSPADDCMRVTVVTFLYRAMKEPEVSMTTSPFSDVPADSWFAPPVLWAVENDITNGTSDTTFSPDAICNRAEVVTFLYRAYNK